MNFDIFGMLVLFVTCLVIGVLQAGLCVGVMYGMHKGIPDKLEEKTYGQFDFDNFQKSAFIDLVLRLIVVFAGATLVLHLLFSLFFGTYTPKYPFSIGFSLFLLETAAIAAGLFFLLKLDPFRLAVLGAANALIYLFLLWLILFGMLH